MSSYFWKISWKWVQHEERSVMKLWGKNKYWKEYWNILWWLSLDNKEISQIFYCKQIIYVYTDII